MAITGSGTQADPFIVHNYTEFISLSDHASADSGKIYIQFFDVPQQTINCNSYGSEFKWGRFVARQDVEVIIDLNGATIKNLIVDSDIAMFYAVGGNDSYPHWHPAKITVKNGAIRNVFMGSGTSRVAQGEVTFFNVSLSVNSTGNTVEPFIGISGHNMYFDNCSLYLVQATIASSIIRYAIVTDTDFKLYINNINDRVMFTNDQFTGCRFQGKIKGRLRRDGGYQQYYFVLFGYNLNGSSSEDIVMTNCVVDIDLSEATGSWQGATIYIYRCDNGASLNTNVFCNSHPIPYYSYPSSWNYMDHEGVESIRNGSYLNEEGFVCAIVVAGG